MPSRVCQAGRLSLLHLPTKHYPVSLEATKTLQQTRIQVRYRHLAKLVVSWSHHTVIEYLCNKGDCVCLCVRAVVYGDVDPPWEGYCKCLNWVPLLRGSLGPKMGLQGPQSPNHVWFARVWMLQQALQLAGTLERAGTFQGAWNLQ